MGEPGRVGSVRCRDGRDDSPQASAVTIARIHPSCQVNILAPVGASRRGGRPAVGVPALAKPATQPRPPEPKKRSMFAPLVAGLVALVVIAGGTWYFLLGNR